MTKLKPPQKSRSPLSRSVWLIAALLILAGAALATLKCHYCGKVIEDTYITYDGKTYHPSCYHRNVAPRCAVCSEEIVDGGVIFDGKNYHKACYEEKIALRCSVCGGIIEGQYLIDHWGNKYHKHHEQEIASCSFCGRLLSDPEAGGGLKLDATHHICQACNRTAVSDMEAAQPLIDQILGYLSRCGIKIKPKSYKFKLVTRSELSDVTGRDLPDQYGLTFYQKTEYWGFLEDKELRVYVLSGLPRMHFISSAAHELMHVWLFLNSRYNPDEADPQLIEGSCNAASVLVLRRFEDEMADFVIQQMSEEKNVIYGDGYRRVQHLLDNRGVDYWLEHLRLDPQFPIGY